MRGDLFVCSVVDVGTVSHRTDTTQSAGDGSVGHNIISTQLYTTTPPHTRLTDNTSGQIMAVRRYKEAIHSGHFMVSNFEAEEQDEDDIAISVPHEDSTAGKVPDSVVQQKVHNQFK